MNVNALDKFDLIAGFDEPGIGVGELGKFSLGKKLKGVFKKALPIVGKIASIYTGGATGAVLGKAVAGASKRKSAAAKKLKAAKTPAAKAAAIAEYNQAANDLAAAQTVNNGIASGMIPMNATAAQAQQIVVAETLRREGVDPDSEEGKEAAQIVKEASADHTMLYVGAGLGLAAIAAVLAFRR